MTIEKFQLDLQQKSARDIFLEYLQGNEIWYFSSFLRVMNPSGTYDSFKRFVASKLDVHFNSVCIVGSSKLGYSLSPDSLYRPFNETSDIDLVIVSNTLFKSFWDAYLDLHSQKINIGYHFVASNIFRRFISIKNPDPNHPTFQEWIAKIEQFNKDYQVIYGIKNDINYRIYDSWESVERYHIKGISEIQENNQKQ